MTKPNHALERLNPRMPIPFQFGVWSLLACPALAQSPASQPAASPYWLRTTGEAVNLRTHPDGNSLVVARVADGAMLRAYANRDGWHEVDAPRGAFCLVHRDYVWRESPTRGVVNVSSGTLRVRAGSLVSNIDPWTSPVVSNLERGAAVEILGEQGEWLQIAPPEGAHFFVSEEFVTPVPPQQAAGLAGASAASALPASVSALEPRPAESAADNHAAAAPSAAPTNAAPASAARRPPAPPAASAAPTRAPAGAAGTHTPAPRPAGATQAPAPTIVGATQPPSPQPGPLPGVERVDAGSPWGQRIVEIDAAIRAERSKPLGEQSWTNITERLRVVAAQRKDETAAAVAREWVAQIEGGAGLTSPSVAAPLSTGAAEEEPETAASAPPMSSQDGADRSPPTPVEPGQRPAPTALPQTPAPTPTPFASEGTAASTVPGQPAAPKPADAQGELAVSFVAPAGSFGLRYRLIDPSTRRTRAYVEFPFELAFDAPASVGKYVGVRGEALKENELTIIRAQTVTVVGQKP